MRERHEIIVEDAVLNWRNFAGNEIPPFNPAGHRTFCVDLDPENAQAMLEDGWNVKFHKLRDDDDDEGIPKEGPYDMNRPFISVRARFDKFPPNVFMISSAGRTRLTEDMIETLDYVDITKADVIINGSWYDVNGKQGLKAYLKTMFVTIAEDYLELKYAITEDSEEG